MMTQKTARTALTLTIAGLALTFALTACSSSKDDSTRSTDSTTTTSQETAGDETVSGTTASDPVDTAANDLMVGDCVDTTSLGSEVDTVPTVDCATEHDGEVHAVQTVEGDTLPSDIEDQAAQLCLDAFEPYVGIGYDDPTLDVQYIYPSTTTYVLGDDQIQCIVTSPTPVTASVAGSGL